MWSDEGLYVYDTVVPESGDRIRQAAFQLLHDCESYLFDTNHPGYGKPEYLSWAMARFQAQHASSGNPQDRIDTWDAEMVAHDSANPDLDNDGDEKHASWTGNSAAHFGVRYPKAALAADWVDTDEKGDD
jgi:hypothetical protein